MNQENQLKYSYISDKIILALEFSARAHKDQFRKDELKTPYFSHPAGIGLILAQTGCREEVVMAGILHDVIEDTEFTYEDIVESFGKEVADLVRWVSIPEETKGIAGKESYLKNLANAPAEARLISAADMLYNRADMLIDFFKDQKSFNANQFKSYVISELNEQRIEIIEAGLGPEHELVKDLKSQNEVFKKYIY